MVITGDFDFRTAPTWADKLLDCEPPVTVDLTACDYLDSSGIGVLVALWRRHGALKVQCPARFARVFKVMRLDQYFEVERMES